MATLTIMQPDDTHKRLKSLAKKRHLSVNKLFEEFSTTALAELDAEPRFLAQVARGNPERVLELLNKINQHFDR